MKIQGHEVEVKHDGIKVGCTFIPLKDMEGLVKEVKNTENRNAKLEKELRHAYYDSRKRVEVGIEVAARCFSIYDFMQVRGDGNYKYKGFFLGAEKWRVEKDDVGFYVLLPPEE